MGWWLYFSWVAFFSTLDRRCSDSDGDVGLRLPARDVYFITEPSLQGQLRSCFRARSLVFFLCQLRGVWSFVRTRRAGDWTIGKSQDCRHQHNLELEGTGVDKYYPWRLAKLGVNYNGSCWLVLSCQLSHRSSLLSIFTKGSYWVNYMWEPPAPSQQLSSS